MTLSYYNIYPFFFFILITTLSFSQTSSHISFKIKNIGINVDGHFNTFTFSSNFDNDTLESISGTIDVASIDTGITGRDEHLLKSDYFDVEKHPTISFGTSKIKPTSSNTYSIAATLTIKGVTKKFSIPLEVVTKNNNRQFNLNFKLNRRDFDVGGGSFILSKTVVVDAVFIENIK